ncbi:uncharacterized protein LOC126815779 [Patella vulgata]|uniref:uncharacterized protein LOC126815779 n=1 Tax=Patella vulgata TaxID=6465 RepID=UPI0021806483|nr:uncharacterized protein LOC126815779 [Patella vulgata]XP_050397671.1 uncharacterized protein LOC126815779 [Patella vulgata]XP_050397672.1 uncharacterized protein LOC126815779 [Patella vulgata]
MAAALTARSRCAFWDKCYRKNKAHLKEYIHPGDSDEEEMDTTTSKTKTDVKDDDTEMKDVSKPSTSDNSTKRKAHDISDDEDDEVMGSSKTKKVKTTNEKPTVSTSSAAETPPVLKFVSQKGKCKYWNKCYRKEKQHRLEFLHPGDDIPDEKMDKDEAEHKTRGKSKELINALMDDQTVEFDSGYKLTRKGDNYTCTCNTWKGLSEPIAERTCKHLKEYLGEEFENNRVADAKPKKKIIKQHINVSLLLAHKYDEKVNDPIGWWMSEKLDGVRAFWNGRCFYSRLGNCFIAPQWFTKDLPTDMHLDGELFGGRGKFQSTVKIVKNQECDDWKKVKYHVFDAPNLEKEPFEKRYEAIKEYFDSNDLKYAVLCEQTKCKGKDHIKEEMKRILALSGEGLMIRQPKSKYDRSRSKTLLKIKKFHDAEARVVGYKPGTGRFHNATGALLVEMANGKQFYVGSGLTDADRRKPPKKGTIITYKFQEYTNSGTPRFPSYIGIRIDMTEPKDVILPPKPTD